MRRAHNGNYKKFTSFFDASFNAFKGLFDSQCNCMVRSFNVSVLHASQSRNGIEVTVYSCDCVDFPVGHNDVVFGYLYVADHHIPIDNDVLRFVFPCCGCNTVAFLR